MNELEKNLGLLQPDPIECFNQNPTAFNLRNVPLKKQTLEMLYKVMKIDGLALEYAYKGIVMPDLCEIAVSQNGIAIRFIPKRLIKYRGLEWYKELCEIAVTNNGRALEFIPEDIKTNTLVETAIYGPIKYSESEKKYQRYFDRIKYPINETYIYRRKYTCFKNGKGM